MKPLVCSVPLWGPNAKGCAWKKNGCMFTDFTVDEPNENAKQNGWLNLYKGLFSAILIGIWLYIPNPVYRLNPKDMFNVSCRDHSMIHFGGMNQSIIHGWVGKVVGCHPVTYDKFKLGFVMTWFVYLVIFTDSTIVNHRPPSSRIFFELFPNILCKAKLRCQQISTKEERSFATSISFFGQKFNQNSIPNFPRKRGQAVKFFRRVT